MMTNTGYRALVSLLAAAVISLWTSPIQAQPSAQPLISVSPNSVKPGTLPMLTITSSGALDLSQVTAPQLQITPGDFIGSFEITNKTPTSLTFRFAVERQARGGERKLSVTVNNVTVSIPLMVEGQLGICDPACRPPTPRCEAGRCVPALPPPPTCNPPCQSPARCENGVCKVPQ
jgi:hypothetical protein